MLDIRPLIVVGVLLTVSGISLLDRTMFVLEPLTFAQSTKIYDRHGVLLYELYGEMKRTPVPFADIPDVVKEATIAAEDKDFYKHPGFDAKSIVRAAIIDVKSGELRQGGSTISQQLVRNALLTREKSFGRKFKEIVLSLKLEREYTKDEILAMYLNIIPYGSNAYGIEAASESYFGKHAQELTLYEAAYLAALPKAPTYYSPYGTHRDELDARVKAILEAMKKQGYATEEQIAGATAQPVAFKKPVTPIRAPHFVMFVIDQLQKEYGEDVLLKQGLEVTTTLDLNLQTTAEELIDAQVVKNQKRYNGGNAALVSMNPRTGEILAMVGSHNYFDPVQDGAVNVALQPRQPGSSFKPYVYATAFQKGMNPATMLMDVVTNFGKYGSGSYIPRNYDGRERGPVSARQALQGSLNIPAVKTLFFAGIQDSITTAQNMGITTLTDPTRYGPSLALGGAEVTLLDHTSAFGVFATGGVKHEVRSILSVKDHNGVMIKTTEASPGKTVLDPAVAYQITNILSDNNARQYIFGSLSRNLVLGDRPVAAKTGTTQENRDGWAIGFTPSLVTGVWVGNSDNTPMRNGADGSIVAAPIWHAFMEKAVAGTPVEAFARPSNIIEMAVDTVSGKLPTKYTPQTKMEIFAPFNVPTQRDDVHVPMGLGDEEQVVTILHSEDPKNPYWEHAVQRWMGAAASAVAETNESKEVLAKAI